MIISEIITEVADNPYAFMYSQIGTKKSTIGFNTDDGSQFNVVTRLNGETLDVSFAKSEDGENISVATGQSGSSALRIFGTVLCAAKTVLKKLQDKGISVKVITFSANNAEPRRVALYTRMAKNISVYLSGWNFIKSENIGDRTVFTVGKNV